MDAERLIETLKREQTQLAVSSLLNPRARDAFEFGLIAGQVQAYERVLEKLNEQLAETEGKPKPQARARMPNPYLQDLDQTPTLPEQYKYR